ncbi:hypothetical protein CBL_14661 [Carabus blaptoides fortunei]
MNITLTYLSCGPLPHHGLSVCWPTSPHIPTDSSTSRRRGRPSKQLQQQPTETALLRVWDLNVTTCDPIPQDRQVCFGSARTRRTCSPETLPTSFQICDPFRGRFHAKPVLPSLYLHAVPEPWSSPLVLDTLALSALFLHVHVCVCRALEREPEDKRGAWL